MPSFDFKYINENGFEDFITIKHETESAAYKVAKRYCDRKGFKLKDS